MNIHEISSSRFYDIEYVSQLQAGALVDNIDGNNIKIRLITSVNLPSHYANNSELYWQVYNSDNISDSRIIPMKPSEQIKCLRELNINNSSELKFVYTCDMWRNSPSSVLIASQYYRCHDYLCYHAHPVCHGLHIEFKTENKFMLFCIGRRTKNYKIG